MLGILNVYKPKGKTSHDIVNFVRRTINEKRVGHIGTLDPMAEGVLPILIGKATKLSGFLTAERKTYIATVRLGITTDTYDITGTVLSQLPVEVTKEQIGLVLANFIGEVSQLPPMYSAIKIGGKKLYQLARKGQEIERPTRNITIYQLDLLKIDLENNEFTILVDCSKGTYIRTLCYDIGKALGCGASMSALIRSKNGRFTQEEACTLEDIECAVQNNTFDDLLITVDEILSIYPKITVSDEVAVKVKNGLRLRPQQLGIETFQLDNKFRIYDKNELLCLSSVILENTIYVLKMEMSFY